MLSDIEEELRADAVRLRAQLQRERRARHHRLAVNRMAAETSGEVTRHGVADVIAQGASDIFECHWVMVAFTGDDDTVNFVHGPGVPDAVADDWNQAPLQVAVPIGDVLRGETASIALASRDDFGPWPILIDEADRAEIGSLYVVALPGDERPHAAVALAWADAHEMDDAERELLDELIDASTPAFARAVTTEVDRELVSTLQTWLLPAEVPPVPGLDLATLYEPGRVAMDVGGDWYDVVRLDAGRSAIVVGDVVGHDARAAAEMGQVRHVLATHLMVTGDSATSLRLTDDYFHRRTPNTMATALVMVFDAEHRSIELASAGHLAPVVAELGAIARVIDCGLGPPIGSGLGGYTSMTRAFPAHALLVAFTDGLVELRDQTIDESLDQFCRAIDACIAQAQGDAPPQSPIDLVMRMLAARAADPDRTDDAAAVVCRST